MYSCVRVCVSQTKFFTEFHTETEEEKHRMLHNLLLEYHIAIHCGLISGELFLVWPMSKQELRTWGLFQCFSRQAAFSSPDIWNPPVQGSLGIAPLAQCTALPWASPVCSPSCQWLCRGKWDTKKVRVKYVRNKKPEWREENGGS